MFSCEFCKILRTPFFYKTPPVAASLYCVSKIINRSFLLAKMIYLWYKILVDEIRYCCRPIKVQKQPPEVFCKKGCSENFFEFHKKTPVLESLFNKVAGLRTWNVIKKTLQHSCFPVSFVKFLRTPILKNFCERLLLKVI